MYSINGNNDIFFSVVIVCADPKIVPRGSAKYFFFRMGEKGWGGGLFLVMCSTFSRVWGIFHFLDHNILIYPRMLYLQN